MERLWKSKKRNREAERRKSSWSDLERYMNWTALYIEAITLILSKTLSVFLPFLLSFACASIRNGKHLLVFEHSKDFLGIVLRFLQLQLCEVHLLNCLSQLVHHLLYHLLKRHDDRTFIEQNKNIRFNFESSSVVLKMRIIFFFKYFFGFRTTEGLNAMHQKIVAIT